MSLTGTPAINPPSSTFGVVTTSTSSPITLWNHSQQSLQLLLFQLTGSPERCRVQTSQLHRLRTQFPLIIPLKHCVERPKLSPEHSRARNLMEDTPLLQAVFYLPELWSPGTNSRYRFERCCVEAHAAAVGRRLMHRAVGEQRFSPRCTK